MEATAARMDTLMEIVEFTISMIHWTNMKTTICIVCVCLTKLWPGVMLKCQVSSQTILNMCYFNVGTALQVAVQHLFYIVQRLMFVGMTVMCSPHEYILDVYWITSSRQAKCFKDLIVPKLFILMTDTLSGAVVHGHKSFIN